MIVDAHAHITKKSYGSVEKLLEIYNECGIDKGVLVPGGMIDVRKITKYITNEEQPDGTYIPNNLVENAINKYPDRFFGFYCVNPHLGKYILDEFEEAVKVKGFRGLKLAPMVHQFSMSSKIIEQLVEICGNFNIPFYSHVVYSPAASTKKFVQLAEKFPKTNFILGHMGFGPSDVDAVHFAKIFDNIYLETSQGSYLIIKEALKEIGAEKIIFGSEYPMYHPEVSLKNILVQQCIESDMEKILSSNILNLISS